MPRFSYSAYDGSGRLRLGEVEAPALAAVLDRLRDQGLFPFETGEVSQTATTPWWRRELSFAKPISRNGLQQVTRELATLLSADLPLDEALRLVVMQSPSGRMRTVMNNVLARVLDGDSLSAAMQTQGTEFPDYYVGILAAGEASGTLAAVFEDMAKYLDKAAEVRARITSALIYPMVLVVAALAAIALVLMVLVPALIPVFADAGTEPPLTLQLMLQLHDLILGYWPVILGGFAVILVTGRLALADPGVKIARDRLLLRIPLIGTMITGTELARFARVLATLQRNGVPLLSALAIGQSLTRNTSLRKALAGVATKVKEGGGLSRPLAEARLIPPLFVRLVTVGEETGQLDRMLTHIAGIYEVQIQRRIDTLMALLTPALTLIIGLGVGGLILSVMNAILSVNDMAFK